jgi:Xaa-Pro aminopeptidase
MDYEDRLRRATERLEETGSDALVVGPSPDLVYLTGHDPMPLERPTVLVLRADADPVLLVPELERPLAGSSVHNVEISGWRDGVDPYEAIAARLPAKGRVAVTDRLWGVHVLGLQTAAPFLTWTSASWVLGPLRARKEPEELDALRRAAAAADATFADVCDRPFAGRSERQVAEDIARSLVEHGHGEAAFTIVASGPNGASPHHRPGERVIEPGDAIVLDFGGALDGYYSDITRTVVVERASPDVEEIHAVVLGAQATARETVRPGVPIEEVDRAARKMIEDAGFGERFIHRTGHGIGLEVHEPPYAVAGDTTVLEPAMTFSVEPGIYLPGRFGVRIEDIVTVTDVGSESLNEAPRELRVVR